MLELGLDPDLALEALGAHGGRDLGAEDLDGDRTVVPEVPGAEHDTHASVTDLAVDLVSTRQRRAQARVEVHPSPPTDASGTTCDAGASRASKAGIPTSKHGNCSSRDGLRALW